MIQIKLMVSMHRKQDLKLQNKIIEIMNQSIKYKKEFQKGLII